MGPPKTPTNILKARGSWRAQVRRKEPCYPVATPKPPDWVYPEAVDFFLKCSRKMAAAGVMTSIDFAALGYYANAHCDYCRAKDSVASAGHMLTKVNSAGDVVAYANPAVNQMWQALDKCIHFQRQFGMTPASRASVETSPDFVTNGAVVTNGNPEARQDDRFFKTA